MLKIVWTLMYYLNEVVEFIIITFLNYNQSRNASMEGVFKGLAWPQYDRDILNLMATKIKLINSQSTLLYTQLRTKIYTKNCKVYLL